MRDRLVQQVRRIEVTEPIAAVRRYDYADAFELRLPEPDTHSPEVWVRAGLDATPRWVDRVLGLVLGMSSPSESQTDHIDVFRIIESTPEMVHLETSLPLMNVVVVGRNVEPTRRMFTTVLHYERPAIVRPIWAIIGIGHRWAARRLVASKVGRTDRSKDMATEHA